MRLALCFSGHPRTFEKSFSYIKNQFINKYNCDIFISTYNVNETISKKIIDLYNPKKINFNEEREVSKKNDIYINNLDLVKTLNFVDIRFEDNIKFNKIEKDINSGNYTIENFFEINGHNIINKKFENEKLTNNFLGQFFGMYDVSKLCLEYIGSNDVKYDYILRLRLDCFIEHDFEIEALEENQILINHIQNYNHSIKLHDHFFMARQETYFKIANIYNNLENIIEFINNKNCWLPNMGNVETLLLIHIILCKIEIKETNNFNIFKLL